MPGWCPHTAVKFPATCTFLVILLVSSKSSQSRRVACARVCYHTFGGLHQLFLFVNCWATHGAQSTKGSLLQKRMYINFSRKLCSIVFIRGLWICPLYRMVPQTNLIKRKWWKVGTVPIRHSLWLLPSNKMAPGKGVNHASSLHLLFINSIHHWNDNSISQQYVCTNLLQQMKYCRQEKIAHISF